MRQQLNADDVPRWASHGAATDTLLDQVKALTSTADAVVAREVLGQAARSLMIGYNGLGKSDPRVGNWYVQNYALLVQAADRVLGEKWELPWRT